MSDLSIGLRGIEALTPLDRFRFEEAAARWAAAVEPFVEFTLRAHAPVGQGPGAGRLRDSIGHNREFSLGSARINFTASAPHARFVVDGTRPHIIRPRQAHALHWQRDGRDYFARLVHHPGTKPNPFGRRVAQQVAPFVAMQWRAAVTSTLGMR